MTLPYAHPTLRREVGLFGAVMLGLGSILGTGVFVALPLKTAEAGLWIIPAIVVAGLVALCNALSSAQLAAAHPVAGGTYEYGYRFLKPWLGFTAGWTFLLAKSASAATAALGVGTAIAALLGYSIEAGFGTFVGTSVSYNWVVGPLPLPCVAVLSACALFGLRRTNRVNSVFVAVTILGLIAFCFAQAVAAIGTGPVFGESPLHMADADGWQSFLPLVAWAFVSFTGYGRLATLGEEVHQPTATIPRAIFIVLGVSLVLYVLVALATSVGIGKHSVLWAKNPGALQTLVLHYALAVDVMTHPRFAAITLLTVSLAAVTAMLGVLLNLILGLSRVWLAMARRGDAPAILARIHEPTSTPRPAVVLTGVVIAALVLVGDVRLTWSFSAFTVLIYYAITNWAALKLPPEHRLYPRWIAWCGLIACASLAWFVEWRVWATGVAIILVGLAWHAWRRRAAPALTA
jgi:APA family basic amino acid/polyamine antiporter